ncbi:chitin synthase III catalytic subunit-domain-containing protein [Lactarius hengduanensis]|nr:chitin synthase III catalytic subunit-domain-containing protein [Lactarius hengduanensis]
MTRFGDFKPLCRDVPSYPWCNLFYRELQHRAPAALLGASFDTKSAPVGINPSVAFHAPALKTPSATSPTSLLAPSASSSPFGSSIAVITAKPLSARRVELRAFLVVYLFTLPLQLVTTGSFLQQGSTTLVVFTAIHAGAVAALFWTLLGNAIVATQCFPFWLLTTWLFSPFTFSQFVFMAGTTYVSLDIAFTISSTLEPGNPKDSLHSITLFVLTSIWPGAAALVYFILMGWIVAAVLREMRPLIYYGLAGLLFILAQLAFFLLSRPICNGTNAKIDGSFIATVLDNRDCRCALSRLAEYHRRLLG